MHIREDRKGFTLTKDDFEITWFSGTGAGGQKRNKCQNCCRIRHPESGVVENGTEERSRVQNQRAAFTRLVNNPRMKSWLDRKLREIEAGETLEQQVDKEMEKLENFRFEIQRDGRWVEVAENEIVDSA